jgi:aminotransferase
MALTLHKRAEGIVQAEIRVMTIECKKISGINLAQGVCDVGVPEEVSRGTVDAIYDGVNCYTRYDGLTELRQAIAKNIRF